MRCLTCYRRIASDGACPDHPGSRVAGGTQPDTAQAPKAPAIDGYRDWAYLASGGFGDVFRARSEDGQVVAIKLSRAREAPRLEAEGAILSKLGALADPLTPILYEQGRTADSFPFLAMEHIDAPTLGTWMLEAGAGLEDRVLHMFRRLCETVDRLHAAGYIHRDLKPENVFIRGERVVLIDFGLGLELGVPSDPRIVAVPKDEAGKHVGTAAYTAPEQVRGAEQGVGCDLYSLAVIFFELASHRLPFVGSAAEIAVAQVAERPRSLSTMTRGSAQLDYVMRRALDKNWAERFPNALALAHALEEAVAQGDTRAVREHARPKDADSDVEEELVAILAFANGAPSTRELLSTEGGTIVKRSADTTIACFRAATATRAVRAATKVATRLQQVGAWSAIHLASVRVRSSRRRQLFAGPALAGDWIPAAQANAPVHLTKDAADVLPEGATTACEESQLRMLAPYWIDAANSEISLFGRRSIVESAVAELGRAKSAATSALISVIGDTGMGRTRVLGEIAGAAADHPRVVSLSVPAPDIEARGLLEMLADIALGDTGAATPKRLETAAIKELGLGHHEWRALARVLGHADDSDDGFASPAIRRQLTAAALGRALARRARTEPLLLCIDDMQHADFVALDALEIATLPEHGASLLVCVAATPQMLELRPAWGDRAAVSRAFTLEPLVQEDAISMLRELLAPAEYIPEEALAQLADWAGYIPGRIAEAAAAMRTSGALHPSATTTTWVLDFEDMPALLSPAASRKRGARWLAQFAPQQQTFLKLCCVLGDDIDPRQVERADTMLEPHGLGSGLDAKHGLRELTERGVLKSSSADRYCFAEPWSKQAIHSTIEPAARRLMHGVALEAITSLSDEPAPFSRNMARHAEESGDSERAAELYLRLGHSAAAAHSYVEARQHFAAALANAKKTDHIALAARLGRATTNNAIGRHHDAIADLQLARDIATQCSDSETAAKVCFELAITYDWACQFAESAEAGRQGIEHLDQSRGDSPLQVRRELITGLIAFRAGKFSAAVAPLRAAARLAAEYGDHETELDAGITVAGALNLCQRYEEAESALEGLLQRCEETGDRMHLGAAYTNRMCLDTMLHRFDRAISDGDRVLRLARELGNYAMERAANYNLAELLLWNGQLERATTHAQRSLELQQRFFPGSIDDQILDARIRLTTDERESYETRLAEVLPMLSEHADELVGPTRHFAAMLRLSATERYDEVAWAALLDEAREDCSSDEYLELLWAAAAAAKRGGAAPAVHQWQAQAIQLPGYRDTTWPDRFAALARPLGD